MEHIRPYVDAGFDHLVLVQIGPDQKGFFEFFERELAPALATAFGGERAERVRRGDGDADDEAR